MAGLTGQAFAHRAVRVKKGTAWQLQTHSLKHHLIAVRRSIKGTGAGAMVRIGFCLQQRFSVYLTFGIELPNTLLFLIRQARRHGTSRHKHGR